MKKLKLKKGFSLVELLVVITIIAILSVVAYTAIGGQTAQARDSKRKQDLSTIQSALELYFVEFNRYPALLENGTADAGGGWRIPRKYLSTIPVDPKADSAGTPINYYYYYDAGDNAYMIGTTLENEGTLTAHIVGNFDNHISVTTPAYPDNCDIEVDETTCLPYNFD
ncbi:type II secretion system protein [Candidatus Peregrinibacteria bacterium]|nr:type II secretion system protein [Candidatus Peregrinibacteria bacterium]